MSKLKYAIIGSGTMGQEHIKNINLIDNAEVVAICDSHKKSIDLSTKLLKKKVNIFFSPDITGLDECNVIGFKCVVPEKQFSKTSNLPISGNTFIPILSKKVSPPSHSLRYKIEVYNLWLSSESLRKSKCPLYSSPTKYFVNIGGSQFSIGNLTNSDIFSIRGSNNESFKLI